ncbi:polymorphic toxin-type HINT domain-containing protein [Undibacterium sp. TJN19]|uniref:polymorphic toxin-type HINT domain-containing protein n=1 Tax=Undibacterium sp. TJN19 TaxID=3413055 RepID=UPI003BF0BB8F
MNKDFARKLISDPNDQIIKQLFQGVDGVFWVDWREADEVIIDLAAKLIGNDELSHEWNNDKLMVKFRGKLTEVPLKFEPGEQYITLVTLHEALYPEYEIRYIKASQGGDAIAYMVLKRETLFELDAEFGTKVADTLQKVERGSAHFKQAAQEQAEMKAATEAAARELTEQKARVAAGGPEYLNLVHTREGLKPIDEIKVGDWVLSHPENEPPPIPKPGPIQAKPAEAYFYRQVVKVFVRETQKVSHVQYIDTGRGKDTLQLAPNHLIWTKYGGWTPVASMKTGNVLLLANDGNAMVGKVKHTEDTARVYNIEVDEFRTYFVGKSGVWVHDETDATSSGAAENQT